MSRGAREQEVERDRVVRRQVGERDRDRVARRAAEERAAELVTGGPEAALYVFVVFYLMTVFTLSWGTSRLGYKVYADATRTRCRENGGYMPATQGEDLAYAMRLQRQGNAISSVHMHCLL